MRRGANELEEEKERTAVLEKLLQEKEGEISRIEEKMAAVVKENLDLTEVCEELMSSLEKAEAGK
tara:strand:+ start:647 stop:841 length:195 start_codon:yes stop_codon:yes gene_type:complete